MLKVVKLGLTAVLFIVAAKPVAAQDSQQPLPQRQETTSARSAASDKQARIDEHNRRINMMMLENQKRLAEREAGGEVSLTPEQQKQLEDLDKRLREVIKLQESMAGTSQTREAQIRIHNERISIITEMSKLRRELDGSTTGTTTGTRLPTQSSSADKGREGPKKSVGSLEGTTSTRQEATTAHNERIRRIIEESQRRRGQNSAHTTSTL